jgi:hypothetical protein
MRLARKSRNLAFLRRKQPSPTSCPEETVKFAAAGILSGSFPASHGRGIQPQPAPDSASAEGRQREALRNHELRRCPAPEIGIPANPNVAGKLQRSEIANALGVIVCAAGTNIM